MLLPTLTKQRVGLGRWSGAQPFPASVSTGQSLPVWRREAESCAPGKRKGGRGFIPLDIGGSQLPTPAFACLACPPFPSSRVSEIGGGDPEGLEAPLEPEPPSSQLRFSCRGPPRPLVEPSSSKGAPEVVSVGGAQDRSWAVALQSRGCRTERWALSTVSLDFFKKLPAIKNKLILRLLVGRDENPVMKLSLRRY